MRVLLDQTGWFMSMVLAGITLFPGRYIETEASSHREMHLVYVDWDYLFNPDMWGR